MGILINGVEMPKPGRYEAVIIVLDKSTAEIAISPAEDDIGYWKEYPLVPIPPYGKLIDADKQDAQIEALIERHLHGYTKSTWDFVCELRDILKRNPTIIPAEDDTDFFTAGHLHLGYVEESE